MNAITKKINGVDPPNAVPKRQHYAFWGAAIGLVAGLATLFAASTAYGAMTGLGAADCVILGSVMTVMLSQPAGLAGLLVGALCGAGCALIAHFVHH
ncbi:MAG: hypothetical protein WBN44_15950 [Woeseiaceae bacterium]